MTKLILIRHGKSSWDDPFGDDHARVLNARGREASVAIGLWLAQNGHNPDVMLVSNAARTVETADLILPAFANAPIVKHIAALYHAAPDTILDLAKRENANCIAVVAHNPGIGMCANGLVKRAPDHRRFGDYPTCATTVLDFAGPITRGEGNVIEFIVPRDLIGAAGRDTD